MTTSAKAGDILIMRLSKNVGWIYEIHLEDGRILFVPVTNTVLRRSFVDPHQTPLLIEMAVDGLIRDMREAGLAPIFISAHCYPSDAPTHLMEGGAFARCIDLFNTLARSDTFEPNEALRDNVINANEYAVSFEGVLVRLYDRHLI
jgi:hypothetical protein